MLYKGASMTSPGPHPRGEEAKAAQTLPLLLGSETLTLISEGHPALQKLGQW